MQSARDIAERWLQRARSVSRIIALVVVVSGCDGVLHEKVGNDVDAGVLGEISAPVCDPPETAAADGHHNAGEDCLGCHHQGGMEGAPPFTFAGTIYQNAGGTAPIAGGAFHVIDALGMDVRVVSEANGNFYSFDLLTFPVVAFRSSCPDVVRMQTPIAEGDGSCNRSGCHTSGFRLH